MAKTVKQMITFMSDFGLQDEWVAVCKAEILKRNQEALILDITHFISPFDVRQGAMILRCAAISIGKSIYLAIVDPGVGGQRKPIVIKTEDGSILIGPDNGLLIPATEPLGGIHSVYKITNQKLWNIPVCPTFHGRDIFAPIAAFVSQGGDLEAVGDSLQEEDIEPSPWGAAVFLNNELHGEFVAEDNFGTMRTNISRGDFSKLKAEPGSELILNSMDGIKIRGPFVQSFSDVRTGFPMFLFDSSDLFSIAVNEGSAAIDFDLDMSMRFSLKKSVKK